MHADQVKWDREHRRKKREAGLKRVEVWVPKEKRQEVLAIARHWRQVHAIQKQKAGN